MQIYYINVETYADRRAFMEGQFEKLGLVAERLAAVTPADLSSSDLDAYCSPRRARWLTPMELCCSLSHVAAARALLASGAPHALVLEDDAVLSARLPRFLAAFEAMPPDLDVLRLETTRGQRLRLLPSGLPDIAGIGLHRSYSWAFGAGGYIVSRRGAAKIVASPETRLHAADRYLFDPYAALPRQLMAYQAKPTMIVQVSELEGDAAAQLPSRMSDRDVKLETQRPYFWAALPGRVARWVERDILIAVQKAWHEHVRGARKTAVPFTPD
jgi:glycosyl transferase family 25